MKPLEIDQNSVDDQFEVVKAAFKQIDEKLEGLLDIEGLSRLSKALGIEVNEAMLNDMMEQLDPEQTGKFEVEAFYNYVYEGRRETIPQYMDTEAAGQIND